jgi:hypothetical protein
VEEKLRSIRAPVDEHNLWLIKKCKKGANGGKKRKNRIVEIDKDEGMGREARRSGLYALQFVRHLSRACENFPRKFKKLNF